MTLLSTNIIFEARFLKLEAKLVTKLD